MQPDQIRPHRLGGILLALVLAAGALAAGVVGLVGGRWWLVLLAIGLAGGTVGVVQRTTRRGRNGTA